MRGCLRKLVGTLGGLAMIVLGVLLLVLPGPGLLCIAGGVGLLVWGWRDPKSDPPPMPKVPPAELPPKRP